MALDNISPYPTCSANVSKDFTTDEMKEIALNGNVLSFQFIVV